MTLEQVFALIGLIVTILVGVGAITSAATRKSEEGIGKLNERLGEIGGELNEKLELFRREFADNRVDTHGRLMRLDGRLDNQAESIRRLERGHETLSADIRHARAESSDKVHNLRNDVQGLIAPIQKELRAVRGSKPPVDDLEAG